MVIAAIVVAAIGSIAFARRGIAPDLQISAKVTGTPTPTAEQPDAAAGGRAAAPAFRGSGSWVMSSLPGCFQERELIRGTLAKLRPKIPPTTERIRPPSVVMSGDCTIVVRGTELLITRGADRLRVPPIANLYREPSGLTLVFIHGTRAEIRRY